LREVETLRPSVSLSLRPPPLVLPVCRDVERSGKNPKGPPPEYVVPEDRLVPQLVDVPVEWLVLVVSESPSPVVSVPVWDSLPPTFLVICESTNR
jgi:hypothetical protein